MGKLAEILKEINSELDQEVEFMLHFRENMQDVFYFFKDADKKTSNKLIIFADKLNVFEETAVNFIKERLTIRNDIKKASKKLSISSNDVDSITRKIKLAIERGKIMNEKSKIFSQEAKVLKEQYLSTK